MAALAFIAAATGAGFALIVVATILVIIGVRQEERVKTYLRADAPPSILALLARRVLGAHHYYVIPLRDRYRPGRTRDNRDPEEPWEDDEPPLAS